MATLLTGERLKNATSQGGFIKGGIASSVEGAKYDFRMSPIVLKAQHGQPTNLNNLTEQQRLATKVEPGEVVFVRTIEELNLPNNVISILSMKRKLSHNGIIILGGFCIDPLYKGPLWFGLYNFSSTPFPLQAEKKLIAALFYELSDEEMTDFPTPESVGGEDFPDELISLIRNYRPIELSSLSDAMKDLQNQLTTLAGEVREDRDWRRDFKDSLEAHNNQLGRLIEGLQEEKDARTREDERIRREFDEMERKISGFWTTLFSSLRITWVVVAMVLGAVLAWATPILFRSLINS